MRMCTHRNPNSIFAIALVVAIATVALLIHQIKRLENDNLLLTNNAENARVHRSAMTYTRGFADGLNWSTGTLLVIHAKEKTVKRMLTDAEIDEIVNDRAKEIPR
jgi:hypothetical protein